MKADHVSSENVASAVETPVRCAQCGWPGIGNMPTGVRVLNRAGKHVLIGQLAYYRMSGVLCSVCQEMESAVVIRPWFIEAHTEYLEQIKIKTKLLCGR